MHEYSMITVPHGSIGQVLVIVALAVLAVVGIEALRRQTVQEFPPGPNSS